MELKALDADVIVIDTPPALTIELTLALYAADTVVVPVGLSRWTVAAYQVIADRVRVVEKTTGRPIRLLALPGHRDGAGDGDSPKTRRLEHDARCDFQERRNPQRDEHRQGATGHRKGLDLVRRARAGGDGMKTAEERKADREARLIANVSGPRTGYTPETAAAPPAPSPIVQGLKLSDVQLWPQERFKPHPSNHVFDSAKTEDYWRDLRRDILEAGAIINPVIALPDGTLLEGHSRLRIAGELAAEGKDLGRIPVRVVASPITPEEAERRVFLGNLSRFEIDADTRAALYARICRT